MRTTLDAAAAGVNGRVSALRVDTAVEGVGVDAVVLVPTHAAGLEARLQRTLGERLGRPVAVRVREVLTADDATVARQQGTLAELKRSVLALQDADPAQQAGLEPQAWALQRWRATRVDDVLADVDDARADAWEQALRSVLSARGIAIGEVERRRGGEATLQLALPAS